MLASAQSITQLTGQQLRRQQQREQVQAQQIEEHLPDVRLPRAPGVTSTDYPDNESPCIPINHITLTGADAADFSWALNAADDAKGRCLGAIGIEAIVDRIHAALAEAGYVTTRVHIGQHAISGDSLQLTLVTGRIRAVRFLAASGPESQAWRNAVPSRPGDILNLTDIEQALENLRRIPGADALIDIVPADQPEESDLLIHWRQSAPVHVSLSADDGGFKATGKYQGGATVFLDNVLGWNELMYFSANREFADGGTRAERGTRHYAFHYSVPAGYWLLSFNASRYRYFQTVAGAFQSFVYSGTGRKLDAKAARVIYRDGVRKTTAALRLFQRSANTFVDDSEMEFERRRMGGFELSLAHKEFIGASTLDGSIAYKRGNRLFGTRPAPEEEYGEGSSRPTIVNAEISLNVPLQLGRADLGYQGDWRRQWSPSPLLFQDRFFVGGRYTVRGFDGESSLSGDNGWLLRNELNWNLSDRHQLYLALDYARVDSDQLQLAGDTLAGTALGWRGRLGRAYVDLFVGRPVHKPRTFKTARSTAGFSVNYEY